MLIILPLDIKRCPVIGFALIIFVIKPHDLSTVEVSIEACASSLPAQECDISTDQLIQGKAVIKIQR